MRAFRRRRQPGPAPPPAGDPPPADAAPPAGDPPPMADPPPARPRRPRGRVEEIGPRPDSTQRGPAAPAAAEPGLDEFAPPLPPPPPIRLAGLFPTAAAALAFAGQLGGSLGQDEMEFGTSPGSAGWWVSAEAPLATSRELIVAAGGQTFVEVDGLLVRDRGWGDPPTAGDPTDEPARVSVGIMTLVRVAGLAPADLPAPPELVVIARGERLPWIVQRALDLGLGVGYRAALLRPLFATDAERAIESTVEVHVRGRGSGLPPSFVSALQHHPDLVACRAVGERLLIQHPFASPLPDPQLAHLPEADPTGATWILAAGGKRCARLVPQGQLSDGAGLVRLADGYQLIDVEPAEEPAMEQPDPPVLGLVRSRTRGAGVDAILLDDEELACVPALLEGHPLADYALLVRGRNRHLVLAPGGVLDRLPLGEPLYCLGPGLLYVPVGFRMRPALPPSARKALFPTDPNTAIVVQPDAALRFRLAHREPVWALWAGQAPPITLELPDAAQEALAEVDRILTPAETPQPAAATRTSPANDRSGEPDWWTVAFELERTGKFAEAAQLHEKHNQLLRAAHLYEREAREHDRSG